MALFFAQELIYISLILFGLFFLFEPKLRQKRTAFVLIFSSIISFISVTILHYLYNNPRPYLVLHIQPAVSGLSANGFPSDHAIITALIASITFIFNKKFGILLWIFAILISFSRVFLELHHVVDVITSFIVAIVSVMISDYLVLKYKLK